MEYILDHQICLFFRYSFSLFQHLKIKHLINSLLMLLCFKILSKQVKILLATQIHKGGCGFILSHHKHQFIQRDFMLASQLCQFTWSYLLKYLQQVKIKYIMEFLIFILVTTYRIILQILSLVVYQIFNQQIIQTYQLSIVVILNMSFIKNLQDLCYKLSNSLQFSMSNHFSN
ncbi:transmembrane protein, putative (macronuclear) [Tetrahymena thermophila SB210]|uniref:Transmembrane protein, putative n=1 Tax=Tetrahymena thermophila (strain SB210) TaxID=312017 RepID=W7XEE8_TETTS|nr:transmembrane protein, putative [Tetrahymena thermophila SB210]EWS74993.1 transmembrane protein, putative [Tetrahymena thermophila SB210]|eukprot:XP_012652451.1 transmembrane protein, putative [Tetrahymena thermophila SB210]